MYAHKLMLKVKQNFNKIIFPFAVKVPSRCLRQTGTLHSFQTFSSNLVLESFFSFGYG